jgi:Effector Associated Constant Component 1
MADVLFTTADAGDDDLRELHRLLAGEPELRGRVTVRGGPPVPGTMGTMAEAVLVALGPGGAGTAIAAVVITYLRQRGRSVRLRVTRADGASVELAAGNVRGLDAQAIRVQAADLARFLDAAAEEDVAAEEGVKDGPGPHDGPGHEDRAGIAHPGPSGALER